MYTAIPYRARTGPEQGFPGVVFPHRENPVFISCDPCYENMFFPVGKKYTGKFLFWPCTDPVRDCSAAYTVVHNIISDLRLQIDTIIYQS